MRAHITRVFLLGMCAGVLACGERDKDLERGLDLMPDPVALDAEVVMVDKAEPSAYVLDLHRGRIDASTVRVALTHDPRIAVRRNGANEALILCLGQRDTREARAEPAALIALTSQGKARRYVLGEPFDSMVQSDDGRYAFVFKSGNAERVLENPNEIAIVDLSLPPDAKGAVHARRLRSFADSPLTAVFSPSMQILEEDRRLVLVLSRANVTLIDLSHLDRQETTVQLSNGAGQAVQPAQVLFGLGEARIYVRGAASNDVFAFNLIARPDDGAADPSEAAHNDFRPFIDQLGVGGTPTDVALYQQGSDPSPKLLVVEGGALQVALVDPTTSEVTTVKLGAAANQLLLFDATSPRGNEVQTRALLYQTGTATIAFLDLLDLEVRRTQNLESMTLERPIAKLIPLLEEHLALVIHDQGGASLIDLADRTISPIRSDAPLQDALFDANQRRLWVGPRGGERVGFLDLDDGTTGEVLLDAPIDSFVPLFAHGQVVVFHPSSVGYATVLDAGKPSRSSAHSIRGFLIADLLSEGR